MVQYIEYHICILKGKSGLNLTYLYIKEKAGFGKQCQVFQISMMKFFNKEDIRDGIIIIKERVSVMGNPHTPPQPRVARNPHNVNTPMI